MQLYRSEAWVKNAFHRLFVDLTQAGENQDSFILGMHIHDFSGGHNDKLYPCLPAHILHQSVNNWRWALVWAAAPAVIVGWIATHYTPEWAQLAFGIPAILLVYGWMIWHRGFGPEDRVLFRRNVAPAIEPELGDGDDSAGQAAQERL